jgi:hypothetical protein
MPAVTAIASAPQKATRIAAFIILAPPALAPTAPSKTRNAREATDTVAVSNRVGVTSAINNGGNPPAQEKWCDFRQRHGDPERVGCQHDGHRAVERHQVADRVKSGFLLRNPIKNGDERF